LLDSFGDFRINVGRKALLENFTCSHISNT